VGRAIDVVDVIVVVVEEVVVEIVVVAVVTVVDVVIVVVVVVVDDVVVVGVVVRRVGVRRVRVVVTVGGGDVVVDVIAVGYGRGVDVPEGVKVVPTTNGVSDVMGIPVDDIGTLEVEDVIVGTLGVVDATTGVSDT